MIIDVKKLAQKLNEQSRRQALQLKARGIVPGISVILVGDDPASQIYTRNKDRLAKKLGLHSELCRFPGDVDQETVLRKIRQLNADDQVDAILLQEPLPKQLNEEALIVAIDPAKDVDGLHPLNLGRLFSGQAGNYPVACTPKGIMTMLDCYDVPLSGANVVIVGRSKLVGKPLLALLNNRNATVTLVGRQTKNASAITSQADVLIVATGVPGLIHGLDVMPGAVVIDVGINRLASGRLVGDVDFNEVASKARLITPVPGGVGPMTIASLMSQSIELARWRRLARYLL